MADEWHLCPGAFMAQGAMHLAPSSLRREATGLDPLIPSNTQAILSHAKQRKVNGFILTLCSLWLLAALSGWA
ncbi:hypothetical protein FRC12_009002 [Ceratobasidium sp. 428]|nr:hypothetical protein FRC12_009002 [Ceratobasidium sp. 428]